MNTDNQNEIQSRNSWIKEKSILHRQTERKTKIYTRLIDKNIDIQYIAKNNKTILWLLQH